MLTTILGLVSGLIGLLSKLAVWMGQKQLIEAGRSEERVSSLEQKEEATHVATKAREEAHAAWVAASDADRMSDDGFSRD